MNKKIICQSLLTASILSIATLTMADEGRGFYVGAFGGMGRSDSQDVEQTGVAHKRGDFNGGFPDFDLKVDVKGQMKRDTYGFAGAQLGYEWAASSKIKPAFELEGIYLGADQDANLANPNTEELSHVVGSGINPAHDLTHLQTLVEDDYGAGKHTFQNHMKMNMGLLLANGVFTYESGSMFKPYVGAGIGLAVIKMKNATSYQTSPHGDPYEVTSDTSEVVNHFNSKTTAYDFALAGQVKVGMRAEFDKHWSGFAEYRYIYVDSTDFTFGSTSYTGHAPTDNWNVKNDSMGLHNGLVGIQYAF